MCFAWQHPRQAPPPLLPAPLRHPRPRAQRRCHPRPPLRRSWRCDSPPQGEEVMYLRHFARLAAPPHPRGHRQPRHTEPHPVGLGRGRVPPIPPPRTRRAHPARPVGPRRAQRALPRPPPRPRRPLPLRGQTPCDERPNGEPARTTLRGRRRARRRNRHLALRPRRSACAPHRSRPRRQVCRARHPPRRYANTRVKRHRPSSQLHCDTPAREPNPSPLAMRHLKEKK